MEQNNSKDKGIQKPGFKLMDYQCQQCASIETVWNSRAKVTPFIISCRTCDNGLMSHVRWNDDIYAPEHIPSPGQRVFIDMPDSLKPVIARKRLEKRDELSDKERKIVMRSIISSIEPDTPWLITWPGQKSGGGD